MKLIQMHPYDDDDLQSSSIQYFYISTSLPTPKHISDIMIIVSEDILNAIFSQLIYIHTCSFILIII